MKSVVISSVRNKIWVESRLSPPKSPVRDVIWVETRRDMIWMQANRSILCRENITYLTARQFEQESVFYPYHIPKGIKMQFYQFKQKNVTQPTNITL